MPHVPQGVHFRLSHRICGANTRIFLHAQAWHSACNRICSRDHCKLHLCTPVAICWHGGSTRRVHLVHLDLLYSLLFRAGYLQSVPNLVLDALMFGVEDGTAGIQTRASRRMPRLARVRLARRSTGIKGL